MSKKTFKYVSIDIETTGVNRGVCDIIEFGAVIDDYFDQKPLADLPKYHSYILPPAGQTYTGEPFALSMHSTIFRRIAEREKPYSYLSPKSLGYSFKLFLTRNGFELEKDRVTINVAGKNFGSFDYPFLEDKTDLFKHVNIRSRIIDPAVLFLETGDESLPGTSKCKERMAKIKGSDVNTEVAHTAIDDALDVVSLVRTGFAKYGILRSKSEIPYSLQVLKELKLGGSIGCEASPEELDAAMEHGLNHM